MANTSLYTSPPQHRFGPSDEARLETLLTRQEQDTTTWPVNNTADFLLSDDGTTKTGKYRFTSQGFRQVAQLLCPGLSKMLPDLSGTIRRFKLDDRLYFKADAQRIFNQMVELRFDILQPYRIIRDEHNKLIEGLMGVKHRSLENMELLRQTREAMQAIAPIPTFLSAALIGRRLLLWYRYQSPLFVIRRANRQRDTVDEYPIHGGYYFSNGEATGSSVHGTFALFTPFGVCLSPFRKNQRVTHIGRDFTRRLSKMYRAVTADRPTDAKLIEMSAGLSTPLGYAELDDKGRKERDKKLARFLGSLGVAQGIATSVVETAISVGASGNGAPLPPYQMREAYAARTFFDLLAALLRIARQLPADRREKAEQAAYSIFTGKFEI